MKTRSLLAIALAATLASGAALAQDTLTGQQVRDQLTAQGYTSINDVEFEDGLWKADARSADGNRMEVRLDPVSGKLFPSNGVSQLTASDVNARLSTAGYTKVHDVEFDDGLWNAEATDGSGMAVELKIDPETGDVIGTEGD